MLRFRFWSLAALPLLLAAAPAADPNRPDPETVVFAAMAAAPAIPDQAAALTRLAWTDATVRADVAARARQEIVGFGEAGLPAMRAAIRTTRPEVLADLVSAFIEAKAKMASRLAPDYLPGLEDVLWYGPEDARRIAIPELAKFRYGLAVLPVIDTAYEMPALIPICCEALGQMGSERARFFLEKELHEGKGEVPQLAASALARVGGKALLPLKAALQSDRRPVREVAARAFLPVAGPDDVSALHEYAASHPTDDAATIRSVREAAVMLEKIGEAKEAAESSSSGQTP